MECDIVHFKSRVVIFTMGGIDTGERWARGAGSGVGLSDHKTTYRYILLACGGSRNIQTLARNILIRR